MGLGICTPSWETNNLDVFFVCQSRILNDEVYGRGIANNQFEFRTDFDVT